jgi:uncharacterized protein (DUF2062 family)
MNHTQQHHDKTKGWQKIKRFFKLLYLKVFHANDTPQRVALGFGIGVFSGIMPGTGPLAALFIATVLRANKASALAASLLTNTWISIAVFIISVKIGAGLMGLNWQTVHSSWKTAMINFHLLSLFKLSILKLFLPVILGYAILAFICSLLAYFTLLLWLSHHKYCPKKYP